MLLQTYGKICDYTTICFVVIESSYDENGLSICRNKKSRLRTPLCKGASIEIIQCI